MKFGGHRNPNTFLNSYMAHISTVDGQPSFLGQTLRRDHIEDFRGMALHRHPQLWQFLPSKMQYELERRPDFAALEEEIETLSEKIEMSQTEDDSRLDRTRRQELYEQELYEQRRQINVAELKKW